LTLDGFARAQYGSFFPGLRPKRDCGNGSHGD